MDYQIAALMLLAASVLSAYGANSNDGAVNTNGCSKEGEERKQSNGWFTCRNGRYIQSGCLADDGSKVDIGLTVRQRNYVYECSQTSTTGGPLALKPVACLRQKGKPENAIVVEPGQRVKDPPFVYECVRQITPNPNAVSLALKAVACANNTAEIPDGGTVVLGRFTYACTRQAGSLTEYKGDVFLTAKGCMKHGKEYPLDQTVIIGSFAYRCRNTPWPSSALEFATVGCASEGRRYDEGEKYPAVSGPGRGRYMIQCRRYNNSWSAAPVSCMDDSSPPVERAIGDTWIDDGGPGDKRLKYVMVCRGDAKSIIQTPIQCIYQPNPNDLASGVTINGGCMKKFTNPSVLVKCVKGADDTQGVSTEIISKLFLKKEEAAAVAEGFRYC